MTLTKKHFEAIAEILNKNFPHYNNTADELNRLEANIVEDLCNYFRDENPLFDVIKFKEAVFKED